VKNLGNFLWKDQALYFIFTALYATFKTIVEKKTERHKPCQPLSMSAKMAINLLTCPGLIKAY